MLNKEDIGPLVELARFASCEIRKEFKQAD